MTEQTHCGFIAIVGRPNVGKSTLLNQILGQRSVSRRSRRLTRHRILGIDTDGAYQAIYGCTGAAPGRKTRH